MKVFLSWSGERSQFLAQALRDWLPLVLQYIDPWLSDKDIAAGQRWSLEVGKKLAETNFGILCLTHENLVAPWVLFEAGALSKIVEASAVYPYLLDVDLKDLTGPLSQFQAKKADRSGTLDLLKAINDRASHPLEVVRLTLVFDRLWPSLEEQLKKIPGSSSGKQPDRPQNEVLEELVTIVRGLDRQIKLRSFEENVRRLEPRILRLGSSVRIRAGEDFKRFRAGNVLDVLSDDVIESLQGAIGLVPEEFGRVWYLRDEENGHMLTIEEARDIGAYFGNREARLVLTTIPF